ncbi:MAG: hypothetical protein K2Y14_07680 [Burkholderiales bacterium]|nr:hypothetical protein [Burkholderiales bacterium]
MSLISGTSWALPTIGVAEIAVEKNTPSFLSSNSVIIPDNPTQQLMQQQLNALSAQIKTQINQASLLQLQTQEMDAKAINSVSFNFTQTEVSIESQPSLINQFANAASQLNPLNSTTNTAESQISYPDYMLFGTLEALNAGNQIQLIPGTNQYSNIYSLDLAINYKLIKTSDQVIVANFIAAGHAGEPTLQNNSTAHIPSDSNRLIQQVYAQLSNEVIARLEQQFNESSTLLSSVESSIKATTPNLKQ